MNRFLTLLLAGILCAASLSAQQLRMVYFLDYPPFSWGEGADVKGIWVDIANEVGRRLGLKVSNAGYPWERAQAMAKSGSADAFLTSSTPERATYMDIGKEVLLPQRMVVVVSTNNPRLPEFLRIATLNDVKRYRIASYIGAGWVKVNLVGAKIEYTEDIEAALRYLELGGADLLIENEYVLRYRIAELGSSSSFEFLPVSFGVINPYFCLRKDYGSPGLIDRIDAELAKMKTDGTLDHIISAYDIHP